MISRNLVSRVIFLILVLLIAQGCASKRAKLYPVNSEYLNDFIIDGHQIPLPEGVWIVVDQKTYSHFFIVWLVKNNTDNPQQFIRVVVNTNYNFYSYDKSKSFDHPENYFYSEIKNNNNGDAQDCWKIERVKGLTLKKIKEPERLYMTFFALTSKGAQTKFLKVSYITSPKPYGLTFADEDKLVRILIKEGKERHKQLKIAF